MKNIANKITGWYIVFLAVYSVSTRYMPTAILCEGSVADILYKIIIIGGGVLALLYVYQLAHLLRPDAHLFLLTGFVVILGISTILNYRYEFIGNVLGMATFISQLIIFYFLPVLMPKNEIVLCIKRTSLFTSLLWTAGCAASLYQYIKNIHYTILSPENHRIRQGIVDGRLFGLFSDPNFAAFTSLFLIVLLTFCIRNTKIKLFKIYSSGCILINICYLIMSNSRTIYIAAVGTILFFVLLSTYNENKCGENADTRHLMLQFGKRTLFTLLSVMAIYAIIFFPLREIGRFMEPERNINDMVRDDVNTENITNNRSTIWKNYLTLYKDKPVFGFSIRSALPYAMDKYPDSYLAKTHYVTHNGYISLLVETGFTGFAVMGAFFLLSFIQSLKKIRGKEKISDNYILFTTLTAAILIFLMCFHDIFFTVNIETMFLYIAIGYICHSNKQALPD